MIRGLQKTFGFLLAFGLQMSDLKSYRCAALELDNFAELQGHFNQNPCIAKGPRAA